MEKQHRYITLTAFLIILGVVFYILNLETGQQPDEVISSTVDPDKVMDAIKYLESENPHIIGESPTEEEFVNYPHIKQIRLALNGYLDGTNDGLEDEALDITYKDIGMNCGLNNFNKSYYQSKFVVLRADENEYGGIIANIAFMNKPDTMFSVWIYGAVGDQRLRTFCKISVPENDVNGYKDYIDAGINNSNYRL